MDVKPNIETNSVSDCIALMPTNIYATKLNIRQKMCKVIKRTIDIIAGLVGVVILIPLTIVVFIAHKVTKDKRTNFL